MLIGIGTERKRERARARKQLKTEIKNIYVHKLSGSVVGEAFQFVFVFM